MAEMKHIHINQDILLKPVFSFLHIFVAVVVMSVSSVAGISAAGLTDGDDESGLWLRMKPTDNVPRPIHIYYKFAAEPCLDDRETSCAQKGLEGHERAWESMETHGRE